MDYFTVWNNSKKLEDINYTFSGQSTAGMRTSFYLHELKILLDAGHQCYNKVQTIFITHTHADHIAALPLIILENVSEKLKTTIYCPVESKNYLINMIDSFLSCNYNNKIIPRKYYQVIGLKSGYNFELKLNNKDIIIDVFESDHSVKTLTYGFSERKKKLKKEYIGLSSEEIVNLKRAKVEIVDVIVEKKFVFCGDTTISIFNQKNILTYPNIIIECTYFDDDDISQSLNRKHMHWSFLKNIVLENKSTSFYLIHISAKHRDVGSSYLTKYEVNNVYIM